MQPVIALDILPTVLAAVGGVLPTDRPIDGVNLLPFVTGEKKDTPHEALFWRFGQRKAVRKGDWKLVQIGEQKPELYNLANDIGETQNLAESNLEKLAGLQSALADWEKGLISPKWSPKQRPTWQDEAEKNQANPQAKQKKPVRGRDDQDQSQREERRRNRRNREKNANLNENTAKD
jgi:arylsulfatase A-like enzyme